MGLSRATVYRQRQPKAFLPKPRPASLRSLDAAQRQQVLDVLHSERFLDKSVREVWATLIDEGVYRCSMRTMYRISDAREVRE